MLRRSLSYSAVTLSLFAATACTPDKVEPGAGGSASTSTSTSTSTSSGGGAGGGGVTTYPYPAEPVPEALSPYFDPPVQDEYKGGYRVVGEITPPSWSWGKIELLEGFQAYRTEGYNLRTQKLRWQDTYEDKDFPVRTYFGELNQQLVDAFNIYYKDPCVGSVGSTSAPDCKANGPTRAEARFALLLHGPKTGKATCDKKKVPVLLVHGAVQNGNVWLFPNGNDSKGVAYPGTTQTTGFVQALEDTGRCTYAVTYPNFHGDNYNQATNLVNAMDRVKELTGHANVDLITWSKGALPVDLYASEVSTWKDFGSGHFDQIAAEQARRVPPFRKDVRVYVPLSGPHLGTDLVFRHTFPNLLIFNTLESAGQGPVTWNFMSTLQCVNWGYMGTPTNLPNPYAQSVCDGRGGTWPDFFTRIYSSNITGLDANGMPISSTSLGKLNMDEGVAAADYSFDKYNLAIWGSIDDSGKHVTGYLGTMQATSDFRSTYPIPNRQNDGNDWTAIQTDEGKWRDWLVYKLSYLNAGYMDDDAGHLACRTMAFDPGLSPCKAKHTYYEAANADSYALGYATYRMMDGIGIKAVIEMGGHFIERLQKHGLSKDLGYLYVVHGTTVGAIAPYEIDGMSCPTCDPHGDGVLFDISIAARDQLTQGWSAADKTARSKQEGVPFGHLEMGATPAIWTKVIAQLDAVP